MSRQCRTGIGYVTMALTLGLILAGCAGTLAKVQNSFEAQRVYEAGLTKYRAMDYAEAIPLFHRAVKLDPSFDDAQAQLAWSYYHTGQYIEATRHFRQALQQQPQWAGLYDGLGWSRYRLERYQLALEAFQQARALDPSYRDAAVGGAYTLFAQERYAEARPLLERLVREGEGNGLQSASKDLEQVRGRYAWTLFYLGEYAKAQEQFAKGVAARSDWAGFHNGLGWTLLRLEDRQRAREHFEKALKIQPEFTDAKEGLTQAKQANM
jgi:protein O-mannosyl-transferase